MPGTSVAPKPGSINSKRNGVAFDWTNLPAEGRQGSPPPIPRSIKADAVARRWWADLWSTPQAAVWDQTGRSLWALLELRCKANRDELTPALSAEMRQHEDRHGLSPKAMMQLRWRIVVDEVAAKRPVGGVSARERLRAVSSPS